MPYYADRYIDSGQADYTITDWQEAIADQQPGGDAFSLESGESSLTVLVPWLKARSFVRFVLGWSYADQDSPYRLRRELPQYHPRFSWLRASTVSFQSIAPVGVQNVGTKVAGAFSNSLPIAKYDKMLATVRFTDHPDRKSVV